MQKSLFPGYTVGPDAYDDIVNVCPAYGKKAAIIGGKKALAAAESLIRKAVEGSGIEITGTFWYGGEASRENMDMLRPQVADADMIFAVGGGKAIDTCKVLAHETHRPFFTFPTIASTCAACTTCSIGSTCSIGTACNASARNMGINLLHYLPKSAQPLLRILQLRPALVRIVRV